MRLVIFFIIGMLLVNMGLHGHLGSYLGALITPEAMIEGQVTG